MEDQLRELRREVRLHRLALVCVGMLWVHCASAPSPSPPAPLAEPARFDRITVGRIDVREADGTLRMVVSNRALAPGPVVDAERGEEGDRVGGDSAGIVFYNERGEENGALYTDGHGVGFSMDRWRQDQTLLVGYGEGPGGYASGMWVWERPDHPHSETMAKVEKIGALADPEERSRAMRELQDAGELGTYRMFVGKDEQETALIELADTKQRARLQLRVDAEGRPELRFLDEQGKATYTLPPR